MRVDTADTSPKWPLLLGGSCMFQPGIAYPEFPLSGKSKTGSMGRVSQENDLGSDRLGNKPSGPHSHQKIHLPYAFPFRETTRADIGPEHTTNGGPLSRCRRAADLCWRCEKGLIADRRRLPFAGLHDEQTLTQKFLRESADLFLPPL